MRRSFYALVLLAACSSDVSVVGQRSDGTTVWCNEGEYYYECTPDSGNPLPTPPADGDGDGDGDGSGSGSGSGSGAGSGDSNCNPDGVPCPGDDGGGGGGGDTPPECQPWPVGSATVLWPPNHKMRTFTLADCAKVDVCANGSAIAAGRVTKITADEEVDVGKGGDGHTTKYDVAILDDTHFDLRSERQGGSDGRVYTVYYVDANNAEGSCQFLVPHNRGPHEGAVDSGTKVTVTR